MHRNPNFLFIVVGLVLVLGMWLSSGLQPKAIGASILVALVFTLLAVVIAKLRPRRGT